MKPLELLDKTEAVNLFAQSLMKAVPLLTEYWPPSMIDFRGGVPSEWRGGLLHRGVDAWPGVDLDANYAAGYQYFSASFGSEVACKMATQQIGALIGEWNWPSIVPPDGEELTRWKIMFKVPDMKLVEMAVAICPAPSRIRPQAHQPMPNISVGASAVAGIPDHLL